MRIFSFLALAVVALGQPKLTIPSASNKQVVLQWSGLSGGATIERRPMGGRYQTLSKTAAGASTFTDTGIDAMTIYQYRVHPDTPAGTPLSNEVTAGPPPTGYSVALATPKIFVTKEQAGFFARSTAMELDGNGDPAILYSIVDPAFNGSKEAELWFLRWDRANWHWNAPVKVAAFQNFRDGVCVARDLTGTHWATVAEEETGLQLLTSADGGATWTKKHTMKKPERGTFGRAIAISPDLTMHWAYRVDSEGVFLLSGLLAEDASKWTTTKLDIPTPMEVGAPTGSLSLALDAKGRPGVAGFGYGPDYNVNALYWAPGQTKAVKIIDSDGVQNDFHTIDITYAGAKPDQAKLLVELNRRKDGNVYPQMWVIRVPADGPAPAEIPTDGVPHSLNAPFSLAIDSTGRGAAIMGRTSGGDDRCGVPKLARGPAAGGAWKTCSPETAKDRADSAFGYGLSLRFAVNDKLYGAWSISAAGPRTGIILWREP